MEVHHHSKVEKKNFREYFFEFIMIFLAVTMGFFAESYREHVSEKSREKEYMKEITRNLKYDTLRCSLNYERNLQATAGIDSLRNEIRKAINGKANTNAMYYFNFLYARESNRAVFNTSAMSELKNSGSLRLINNEKLTGQLSDYYERKLIAAQSFLPDDNDIRKKEDEIFSMLNMDGYTESFNDMDTSSYNNIYDYKNMLAASPVHQLRIHDPKDLEKLYNDEVAFEISIKKYNFWLSICKKAATELISEIQKEYHLESE